MDEYCISRIIIENSDINGRYYWINIKKDSYTWIFIYDSLNKDIFSWRVKFDNYTPQGVVDEYQIRQSYDDRDIIIWVMEMDAPNPNMPLYSDRDAFMVWWNNNKEEICNIIDKMIVDIIL